MRALRTGIVKCSALAIVTVLSWHSAAKGQNFGKFLDPLNVSLDSPDGRTLRLLNDYRFLDPDGQMWTAKNGAKVDGASIPQVFWSFIGGPLEGLYRNASVIHDYYCEIKERDWQSTHRVFYWGMRANNVSDVLAKTMYYAVYAFGPRWSSKVSYNLNTSCSQGICLQTKSILELIQPEKIVAGPNQEADVKQLKLELESGAQLSLEDLEKRANEKRGPAVMLEPIVRTITEQQRIQ